MTDRSVLIAGAGIAGPALAYWLRRHGMAPTVVERARGVRPGGQSVDVRGAGREVVRRMGLEEAVRAAGTGELGVSFVDADGRSRAALGVDALGGEGPTAELEILRGDLAEVLHAATRDDVEYRFADHVTDLDEHEGGVRVVFASGAEREFDLVVGADGLGSATRRRVFGPGRVRPVGLSVAYLTIPRTPSDDRWARWYNAPGGRVVALRPDPHGSTRALLSFLDAPRRWDELDDAERVAELRRVFADAGWEAPRVVDALDAPSADLYVESVGQVRMPTWTRGRIALVGDAGYCPSPISGMGTSVGLVGAYVLAAALANTTHHSAAFAAYEGRLRPYVTQAQKLPPGAPRLATPRTRAGIALFHTALRLGTSRPVTRLLAKVVSPPADRIELPDAPLPVR